MKRRHLLGGLAVLPLVLKGISVDALSAAGAFRSRAEAAVEWSSDGCEGRVGDIRISAYRCDLTHQTQFAYTGRIAVWDGSAWQAVKDADTTPRAEAMI